CRVALAVSETSLGQDDDRCGDRLAPDSCWELPHPSTGSGQAASLRLEWGTRDAAWLAVCETSLGEDDDRCGGRSYGVAAAVRPATRFLVEAVFCFSAFCNSSAFT